MVTAFAVCVVLLVAGPAPSQGERVVLGHRVRGRISGPAAPRDERRGVPQHQGLARASRATAIPGGTDRNVQIYKRPSKVGSARTGVKKTRTDGAGRWRTWIYARQDRLLVLEGRGPQGRWLRHVRTQRLADLRRSSRPSPRISPEVASEGPPPGWGPCDTRASASFGACSTGEPSDDGPGVAAVDQRASSAVRGLAGRLLAGRRRSGRGPGRRTSAARPGGRCRSATG